MNKPERSERIAEVIRDIQCRSKVEPGGEHSKRARATKRGPGRYHMDGIKTHREPKGHGIGAEWLGVYNNTERNSERALKRALGARQFKRQQRAERAATKATQ